MTDTEKIKALKKLMKDTTKQINAIYEDAGTVETPVDIDLVKTAKAMFYEDAKTILKKKEEDE